MSKTNALAVHPPVIYCKARLTVLPWPWRDGARLWRFVTVTCYMSGARVICAKSAVFPSPIAAPLQQPTSRSTVPLNRPTQRRLSLKQRDHNTTPTLSTSTWRSQLRCLRRETNITSQASKLQEQKRCSQAGGTTTVTVVCLGFFFPHSFCLLDNLGERAVIIPVA